MVVEKLVKTARRQGSRPRPGHRTAHPTAQLPDGA
jgi:hypothetical protein